MLSARCLALGTVDQHTHTHTHPEDTGSGPIKRFIVWIRDPVEHRGIALSRSERRPLAGPVNSVAHGKTTENRSARSRSSLHAREFLVLSRERDQIPRKSAWSSSCDGLVSVYLFGCGSFALSRLRSNRGGVLAVRCLRRTERVLGGLDAFETFKRGYARRSRYVDSAQTTRSSDPSKHRPRERSKPFAPPATNEAINLHNNLLLAILVAFGESQ